jgi:hypothetical protein
MEIMEHKMVVLNKDYGDLKKGTKGTIVFDYGRHMFEVEFIVDDESVVEMIHENDFTLFDNIIF